MQKQEFENRCDRIIEKCTWVINDEVIDLTLGEFAKNIQEIANGSSH